MMRRFARIQLVSRRELRRARERCAQAGLARRLGHLLLLAFFLSYQIGAECDGPQGIVVNATNDTISTNGLCSLPEAVNNANQDVDTSGGDCIAGEGDDTINITVSKVTLSHVNNSIDGPNALPSITTDVQVVGVGPIRTIERGGPDMRIFHVAENGTLTIDNLILTKGKLPATHAACPLGQGCSGGAIYNDGGIVKLFGSTVRDSTASDEGGGIHNEQGTVTLTNSVLLDNAATDDGGGLYNDFGTVTLTNSTVSSNQADDDGGGLYSYDGKMKLTGTTVSNNTAVDDGGGIYNTEGFLDLLGGSTVSGNSAADG